MGHVLVADDDEAIVETVTSILEDEGYRVICAPNGKAALDQINAQADGGICVVLLDLMMPVMSR